MKIKAILFYLFIILSLLAAGYYRDFVFKSINALLQAWDHNIDYYLPSSLRFLENYEYETIVNLKWLLTLLFSIVYLAIALITIRFTFKNRYFLKLTTVIYVVIIIVSGLFIFSGLIFSRASEKAYEFARYFMGMAQSPVILMILIPLFKISEKEKARDPQ